MSDATNPVIPAGPGDAPARREPLRLEIIERLFTRLGALYGTKFNDAFLMLPKPVLMQMWAEELADFSLPELTRGLNGCRTRQWPPTLPEFMVLCRPPALAIHPEEAYHEALTQLPLREKGQHGHWSHPAVFHTAMDLTWFELKRQPWHLIKARWCAAFERHLANPDCPAVPPPPKALASPATRPPNAREKAAIAALRASVGVQKKPLTSFRAARAASAAPRAEHPDDAPREAWASPLAEPYAGPTPQPYHVPPPTRFDVPMTESWLTADTGEGGEQDGADDNQKGPL